MTKTFTFAVAVIATCLSLASGAEAGAKAPAGGSKPVSSLDLGSSR